MPENEEFDADFESIEKVSPFCQKKVKIVVPYCTLVYTRQFFNLHHQQKEGCFTLWINRNSVDLFSSKPDGREQPELPGDCHRLHLLRRRLLLHQPLLHQYK